MNKVNVLDIKFKAERIEKEINRQTDLYLGELFELYDQCEEIQNLKTSLENCTDGILTFDDYGHLCYSVEIKAPISGLPYINDYLTLDHFYIDKYMGGEKEIWLSQGLGDHIAVTLSSGRSDCNYVLGYDNKVIFTVEDWMSRNYIDAKIVEYQENVGEFGYIVDIDYYGNPYERKIDQYVFNNYKTIIETEEKERRKTEE